MSLFFFVFAAKNLPEERDTHSHTAEQPSVPQTPAGNAIFLHLSKGFFFSKVKACPIPVKVQVALKHILSKDAEFFHLIEKTEYSENRKKNEEVKETEDENYSVADSSPSPFPFRKSCRNPSQFSTCRI